MADSSGTDPNPYVEVFLGGRATVTGVEIQGNGKTKASNELVWVTSFKVDYSQDHGTTWHTVKDDPTTAGASDEVRMAIFILLTKVSGYFLVITNLLYEIAEVRSKRSILLVLHSSLQKIRQIMESMIHTNALYYDFVDCSYCS